MTKHALIIGGTGFISTYAVEAFANSGYNVTIVTRGNTPDIHGDKVKTRLHVNCRDRVKFPRQLRESLVLVQASQQLPVLPEKWDVVVDFICFEPSHAEDVVKGLTGLTHCFVFISTDSVYEVCKPVSYHGGRREEDCVQLPKSDKELRKLDEYGYEKLLCERVFEASSLPYVAFRQPDVMGEREYPRCRHMQQQSRVMLGQPVYINPEKNKVIVEQEGSMGSGRKQSFVYAGDVARASVMVSEIELAARNSNTDNNINAWSSLVKQAMNLGSHEQLTLQEYVAIIAKAMDVKAYFFSSGIERVKCIQNTNLDSISYTRLLYKHKQDGYLCQDTCMRCKNSEYIDNKLQQYNQPPWSPTEVPDMFVKRVLATDYEMSESSSSSSSSSDSDVEQQRRVELTEEQIQRMEESEDDDMYGYLPSVEQGAINMSKSEQVIPGWKPTPLEQWCTRMTLWYLHQDTRSILDIDPVTFIKKKVKKIQVK